MPGRLPALQSVKCPAPGQASGCRVTPQARASDVTRTAKGSATDLEVALRTAGKNPVGVSGLRSRVPALRPGAVPGSPALHADSPGLPERAAPRPGPGEI